ncbi:MAG: hypothetical protein WAU03_01130 [Candidatus Saccharimonas aalborgensis]
MLSSSVGDIGQVVGGVWPIQEDYGGDYQTAINNAMAFDDVRGFSWRFHADDTVDASGDYVYTRLNAARDWVKNWNTANPTKKRDLALRPIFGQYTPPNWTDQMADYFVYEHTSGAFVPHPAAAGVSNATNMTRNGAVASGGTIGQPNTVFEDLFRAWWRDFFIPFAVDCEANHGVRTRLLHGGWYGYNYSELYYGPAVQQTNSGYTFTQWVNAHKNLMSIVHDELPATMATEFGLSGHGPIVGGATPAIETLLTHATSLFGSGSDRFYASANGWNDQNAQTQDEIFGAGSDRTTEANKQNALEAKNCRVELQHIYGSTPSADWARAKQWAMGSTTGTAPNLHKLGLGNESVKGVWLLEPYIDGIQPADPYLAAFQTMCTEFAVEIAGRV